MTSNMQSMETILKGVIGDEGNHPKNIGRETIDKCKKRKRNLVVDISVLLDGGGLTRKRTFVKLVDSRLQKLHNSLA